MSADRQGKTIYPEDLVEYKPPEGDPLQAVVYTIQPDGKVQINTEKGKTFFVDSATLLVVESLVSQLMDPNSREILESMVKDTAALLRVGAEKEGVKKPRGPAKKAVAPVVSEVLDV